MSYLAKIWPFRSKNLAQIHVSGRAKLHIFPQKCYLQQKIYFGRMTVISGCKHFWSHTRNTEKTWLFALYFLSKTSKICPLID